MKKQKQYSDQLEALKAEDQFTLSQVEKTSKNTNLTDNALDIKVNFVTSIWCVFYHASVSFTLLFSFKLLLTGIHLHPWLMIRCCLF